MRKLAATATVCVLLGAAFACRNELATAALFLGSRPGEPVDAATPPPVPDYALPEAWAALPGREDPAGTVPEGVAPPDPVRQRADVFFVHPTSMRGPSWNASLDDAETNARTDAGAIRLQASAFNACCRVYAPRYRQATLWAFVSEPENERKATSLAYRDVLAAFDHWREHWSQGRPFLLASHSQGSRYALWLLEDRIQGTPLEDRFVAAYVVGYAIPKDWPERRLARIRPCRGARDTGCLLSWTTWEEGAAPARVHRTQHRYGDHWEPNADKPLVCTNPLAWGGTEAPASANLGAWITPRSAPEPWPAEPGATGARCEGGVLFATLPAGRLWRLAKLPRGNLHNLDYQLFWTNVRRNAVERVQAFLAAHGEE